MSNKIRLLLFILPFSTIISQSLTFENMKGTIWIYEFETNVNDSLIFKIDSTYIDYSAELDAHFFGNYKIEFDTLYLIQEKEKNEEPYLDCSDINDESLQKFILTKSNLLKIVFNKYDDTIIKSFDESYLLKKTK